MYITLVRTLVDVQDSSGDFSFPDFFPLLFQMVYTVDILLPLQGGDECHASIACTTHDSDHMTPFRIFCVTFLSDTVVDYSYRALGH
jgi:hypothetical protein